MQPTQRDGMLIPQSRHPDGAPRQLTARELARIDQALANDPPIYRRRPKLIVVQDRPAPAPQPWDIRRAA